MNNISLHEKLAYTTRESAVLLSCSEKTIRRLVQEKRLHGIRIGARRILIPRDSIFKFLEGGC